MKTLIKQVRIIDLQTDLNGKTVDLLLNNGHIEAVEEQLSNEEAEVLSFENGVVLPGLVDVGTEIGDPGMEHREDLQSVASAALAGGFSAILTQPGTIPVVDNKSAVRYLKNQSQDLMIDVFPIGAVSVNNKGKDLTEMIDMQRAGAVAFSDGKASIQHSGMMLRALEYIKAIDGLIINEPNDQTISRGGQMHEGFTSTSLGMKGIPSMAEDLMVQRDLQLAEYADSRLHLSNISTAGAVARVREAKEKGLKVTASVAVLNLYLSDEALEAFDTHLKVIPPLRSKSDQEALLAGLKDGTIDFISSNHVPIEEEHKKLEFPFAAFGAISLETALALSWTVLQQKGFDLDQLYYLWSKNPRQLFHLEQPTIQPGQTANFTVFDPVAEWQFEARHIQSKSKNTALIGHPLKGRPLAVFHNRQSWILGDS